MIMYMRNERIFSLDFHLMCLISTTYKVKKVKRPFLKNFMDGPTFYGLLLSLGTFYKYMKRLKKR